MPSYFRFHVGPFGYSKRLGRTQAQKRAAAKARRERAEAKAAKALDKRWQKIAAEPMTPPSEFFTAVGGVKHHDGLVTFQALNPYLREPFWLTVPERAYMPEWHDGLTKLKDGDVVTIRLADDGTVRMVAL